MMDYQPFPLVPLSEVTGEELLAALQRLLLQREAADQEIADRPIGRRHSKTEREKWQLQAAVTQSLRETLPRLLYVRMGDGSIYAMDRIEQMQHGYIPDVVRPGGGGQP
jgi:hypothetical protein